MIVTVNAWLAAPAWKLVGDIVDVHVRVPNTLNALLVAAVNPLVTVSVTAMPTLLSVTELDDHRPFVKVIDAGLIEPDPVEAVKVAGPV